jgi:ATP-binding cassette subfamily F protein uup
LVFDGKGNIEDYVGGYSDWLLHDANRLPVTSTPASAKATTTTASPSKQAPVSTVKSANKLSYKLQRELDELPQRIENLESEIQSLTAQTQQADFFKQERTATEHVLLTITEKQAALETCYARWEMLENNPDAR